MKVVVLCSGGMDSVTALYEAFEMHHVVSVLSFDYGSKHNARELPMAAWHAIRLSLPHTVINLPFIGDCFSSNLLNRGGPVPDGHYEEASMRQTVVPFRNAILLSIATGYAESIGADGVVIAAHSGDHAIYPDCREPFLEAMGQAMEKGTYAKMQLLRPFVALDKTAILRRGMSLGIEYDRTWSCYKGNEVHCGTCGTCVERREAFILAGYSDPTEYAQTPALPPPPDKPA